MGKDAFGTLKKEEERQFFGGREVLLTVRVFPTGESLGAAHLRAMTAALTEDAAARYLPEAREALEQAVRDGMGYRFTPRVFRAETTVERRARRWVVTLTASLFAGGETLFRHALTTTWTEDGALQYAAAREKKKGRARKEGNGHILS